MATAPSKTVTQPAAAPATAAEKNAAHVVEFVPFGAKDKIKLTIELVKRIVAVKTKSGKNCTDEDAFKFMLMCQARHLNPFEGDAFLLGYDTQDGPKFSLITAHQAFLKRAETNAEFDGMDSGVIVMRGGETLDLVGDWHMPNDVVVGGWATVYFKHRTHPMKKRLRLARFNKGFSVWKDDPGGMICKCAEADALRSSFPTMLGGMFLEPEFEVVQAEEVARPVFDATAALPPASTDPTAGATALTAPAATKPAPPTKAAEPAKAPAPTAAPAPAATPEKKPQEPAQPTLKRKTSSAAATANSDTTQTPAAAKPPSSDRQRLHVLLGVGGCTTEDFVALAIEEGWIDPEIGTWEKIPDARFTEFVKEANFTLVQELLEARKARLSAGAPAPAKAAAPEGQLL